MPPEALDASYQALIDDLEGASDADFEGGYVAQQQSVHGAAITLFETYRKSGCGGGLAILCGLALPVLEPSGDGGRSCRKAQTRTERQMLDRSDMPYGREAGDPTIEEVHVLWITTGLGCDGDSVSITAASDPSIEDVLLGAIPGLPKVHLHNPVLAYTVGDEFMAPFHQAARGELDNFVVVVEGSIPTRI